MPTLTDSTDAFVTQFERAQAQRIGLSITGGRSKTQLRVSNTAPAETLTLDTTSHQGMLHYEPSELVLTARSGTPLRHIEATLAQHQQRLPFEPPHYGAATLGGTIACNLSGPARAYYGAARDYVLGVKMLNGQGHILQFGGQVMKNVAGYDLSRLQCGAKGTLGLLLEISLKVLPQFAQEQTLYCPCTAAQAIEKMNRWAGIAYPISATFYANARLYIRLSGHAQAIQAARQTLPNDLETLDAPDFWTNIREQNDPTFAFEQTLWRISLPSTTPPLPEEALLEWNGALRWVKDPKDLEGLIRWVHQHQGYITLFRGQSETGHAPTTQPSGLEALSTRLKQAFDPECRWNPGTSI